MGQKMDQMKLLNQLRKAQKELKNEIVEVEAGDGAVVVQINGELKVKKVKSIQKRLISMIFMNSNVGSKTVCVMVLPKHKKLQLIK